MTKRKQNKKNFGFNPMSNAKKEIMGSNSSNLKLILTIQPNFKVVLQ